MSFLKTFSQLVVCTLFLVVATGCQTLELNMIQVGMIEEEVKKVFGEPTKVVAGQILAEQVWFYYSYQSVPHEEWVEVPSSRNPRGMEMHRIQTSKAVRYPRFRIVFTDGVVTALEELPPLEL